MIVCSGTGYHEFSYDLSLNATIVRTIGRSRLRSIDRTIGRRPSRLIVHRLLIATTSRTISCDVSCHRYSPIIRISRQRVEIDPGMRPLLEIVAKIADRSHLGQIATNRTIRCDCSPYHLIASTLRSVPAWSMTCQCILSSAIALVIWFLAITCLTIPHLSLGLTQRCVIAIVVVCVKLIFRFHLVP